MSLSSYVIAIIDAYPKKPLSKAEQSFYAFVWHVCVTFSSTLTTIEGAQQRLQEAKWAHCKLQQCVERINRDNDQGRLVELEVGGKTLTLRAESLDGREKFTGLMYGLSNDFRYLNDMYRRYEGTVPRPWAFPVVDPVPRVLYLDETLQSRPSPYVYDFATGWDELNKADDRIASMCSDERGALFAASSKSEEQSEISVFKYTTGRFHEIAKVVSLKWRSIDMLVNNKTIILGILDTGNEYNYFTIDRENYKCEPRNWQGIGRINYDIQCIGGAFFSRYHRMTWQQMNPQTFEWEPFTSFGKINFFGHRHVARYIYAHREKTLFKILDTNSAGQAKWQDLPSPILNLEHVEQYEVDSNNCLWVMGGWESDDSDYSRCLQVFSPNQAAWRKIDVPDDHLPDDQPKTSNAFISSTFLTYTDETDEKEDVLYILEGVGAGGKEYVLLHTYFIQREIWLQSERCYVDTANGYIHASL